MGRVCLLQLSLQGELTANPSPRGRGSQLARERQGHGELPTYTPTPTFSPVSWAGLWQHSRLATSPSHICCLSDGPMSNFVASARGREAGVTQPRCCWRKQICLQECIRKWNRISLGKEPQVLLAQSHPGGTSEQMSRYHINPFLWLWALGILKVHFAQHLIWSKL